MNEADIRRQIFNGIAQIAPEADVDGLDARVNLREELDIDSYDFLSLLVWLNETLGVEIPESDYEKLVSLSDLINYLSERLD